MTDSTAGFWRGTSDAPASRAARAALTPAQRLQWLEQSLDFALASGALARDRAQREAAARLWAAADRPPG